MVNREGSMRRGVSLDYQNDSCVFGYIITSSFFMNTLVDICLNLRDLTILL